MLQVPLQVVVLKGNSFVYFTNLISILMSVKAHRDFYSHIKNPEM
jgi:hypothetical protein